MVPVKLTEPRGYSFKTLTSTASSKWPPNLIQINPITCSAVPQQHAESAHVWHMQTWQRLNVFA